MVSKFTVTDQYLRIDLAIRQIPTFREKYLVLESIASGCRDVSREASKEESLLDQRVQDRIEEALRSMDMVSEQDARALISVGKMRGRDFILKQ